MEWVMELREQSDRMKKAADVLDSPMKAECWVPVPDKALILTYENFLQTVMKLMVEKEDGVLQLNMDALSHELFGQIINQDEWEYRKTEHNVNIKKSTRLDNIQRPPKI